jgi:hypothetical protein
VPSEWQRSPQSRVAQRKGVLRTRHHNDQRAGFGESQNAPEANSAIRRRVLPLTRPHFELRTLFPWSPRASRPYGALYPTCSELTDCTSMSAPVLTPAAPVFPLPRRRNLSRSESAADHRVVPLLQPRWWPPSNAGGCPICSRGHELLTSLSTRLRDGGQRRYQERVAGERAA